MPYFAHLYERTIRWLNSTPNADSVDRRNAAFFQLFLLYFFVAIFSHDPTRYVEADVQRIYMEKAWGNVLPWPRLGMYIDFATDGLMGLTCIICFVIVRRATFELSVKVFLTALLGLLTINYMAFGSAMGINYAYLSQIIAALMLGRRALWVVYGVLVCNYTIGQIADTLSHFHRTGVAGFDWYMVGSVTLSLFVVAALLDQTVKAIRDSLSEAQDRGDRLAAEIIEREKTQQQVTHLEKMRVVGQLASGTAHDFNNILGVILGFARERRRPGVGPPETHREVVLCDALEGVEVAARRGASISRKLLDFSRTEVTTSAAFDVAAALQDIKPMLRQLLPENVQLVIQTPPGVTTALFNRDQFELALLNLAANARDAMPEGGTCTVTLARAAGDEVAVSLRDTGEGMSEETRQRVFEPFFTTKPVGIGTGLGLSVVHGLVDRSGGRMSIESAPGEGTTVTMWLRHGEPAEPGTAPPGIDDIRVLLIDDDDVLRGILVSTLEDYGYLVTPSHDGRSALRHAEDMPRPPHVIVCDHHMPDMDGATVMRRLRQRFPGVPAILISTNAPPDEADYAAGARNYRLPKPFSPDRLAAQISDIVYEDGPS